MAAILKIEKCRYLQNCLADFDKILHDDILVLQSLPAVQKIKCLKIQDGGWLPFLKLLNGISQQPFGQF